MEIIEKKVQYLGRRILKKIGEEPKPYAIYYMLHVEKNSVKGK